MTVAQAAGRLVGRRGRPEPMSEPGSEAQYAVVLPWEEHQVRPLKEV